MAAGRQPLLRGTGQSDADMMGFNILNVNAVGYVNSATLIVDPTLTVEIGSRATGLPFSTLAAAIVDALPGDVIILRPGVHAFDGVIDIFHQDGLKIIGYGAIIEPQSTVNETVKFTVRSDKVLFEGIEFNGMVTDSPTVTTDGCIEVTGQDCIIRNCYFHDWNGYAIHMPLRYDGVEIIGCTIQTCAGGILGEADIDTTADTEGVWIKDCMIQHNRKNGVVIVGPGPDSNHFITGIQIEGNDFANNDTSQAHVPAVSLTFACRGAQVHDNRFEDESSGILLQQVKNGSVSDNVMKGMNAYGIELIGCIGVKINDNLIDARNSAGAPTTTSPILILGDYSSPNDAGQFVIEGNHLSFLKTNSIAISITNANGILLNSNRLENTIVLAGVSSVTVNSNTFTIPVTTQAILIDASTIGCSRISIIGNRFRFTGASINRVITTVDASATGIDDVLIEGNASQVGQTYGISTVGHSGSNAATRVIQIGNTPEHPTVTFGWNNVGANTLVNRVFVSNLKGVDATGIRMSRNLKFKTIGAAITAAASGDVVVVEDGTFNELITAKDGVTVMFQPPASLVCTTASGCLRSAADAEVFDLYHTHAPISSSKASTAAVSITHAGVYGIHADIYCTGTGGTSHGISLTDSASFSLYGSVFSDHGNAISGTGGFPSVMVYPTINAKQIAPGAHIWATVGLGIALNAGLVSVDGFTIFGGGTHAAVLVTANAGYQFSRCKFIAAGTAASAIHIDATATANTPILRDCVLISESGASGSITTTGAQDVKVYGTTLANKGSDPPTSITIRCGIYDVDADVTVD